MGLRSASVVRTRLGSSMLLRVPFGSSFVLERLVLTASVGPAPARGRRMLWEPISTVFFVILKASEAANSAVGCYRGPDLAAVLF